MLAEEEGRTNMRYAAVTTVEELLEMVGVVLTAKALLEHLRDHVGPVELGGPSRGFRL